MIVRLSYQSHGTLYFLVSCSLELKVSVIHMHKQTYACFSLEDFTGHFIKDSLQAERVIRGPQF